jgi:hypothetical protein
MLQEQLVKEIKQITDDKLPELYDLIHYFRLGLLHETQTRKESGELPVDLAKEVIPADWLTQWRGDLFGKETLHESDDRTEHLLAKHLR